MQKRFVLSSILTAALMVGFASAPAFAMDDMKNDSMSRTSNMSSGKMEKSGKMNKINNMSGKSMMKSHKSSNGKMNDGMSK